MIENDFTAHDVVPDALLVQDLVPLMAVVNKEWIGLEDVSSLDGTSFMKGVLSHMRNQFRKDGAWLNRKLAAEKQTRSDEARSKESLRKVGETAQGTAPEQSKAKSSANHTPQKDDHLQEDGDRSESAQDRDESKAKKSPVLTFNRSLEKISWKEANLIERELEIDHLWHKIKVNKRQ